MNLENKPGKYNLANYSPELLFRPPTNNVRTDLLALTTDLSRELGGAFGLQRNLKIGTELEIFFFDPGIDPEYAYKNYGRSDQNSNYRDPHKSKMIELETAARMLSNFFPKEFLECSGIGKLSIEYRSTPQDCSHHLDTIEKLGELIRKQAKILDVRPVVHSQHLHISWLNRMFPISSPWKVEDARFSDYKLVFYRALPLVLLPGELNAILPQRRWAERVGEVSLKEKIVYPEFRALSSEFAHDHVLNLALSIMAVHTSVLKSRKMRPVYPPSDFDTAVEKFKTDEEMISFLGQSVVNNLYNVVRQYPKVSSGEMTIDQVQ